MSTFGPLVDTPWLAAHLGDPTLRVIDFRWQEDQPGRPGYESGHIPGAVFVDLEAEGLSAHETGGGRHPLPHREAFEDAMRAAGVDRDSAIVVYDDRNGFTACRLWWTLRYFGHDLVAVLDNGLAGWTGRLETGWRTRPHGDFVARPPRTAMKLDHDSMRHLPDHVLLLDARRRTRYLGEFEPTDPRAGHIPRARSAPWGGNLDADGRFRSPDQLRHRFQELGVHDGSEVVAYCGSGVSACVNLLGLEVAGLPGARLYPGSWSDWSTRSDAPIATADETPRPAEAGHEPITAQGPESSR
jgi:thiosulfate/3-mercaptopyruvate sulfurtransferase